MNERSFTVFPSYAECLREMDGTRRLALYDAIFSFGIYGQEPELEDSICKAIFSLLKPTIAKSVKAHEDGKKGGEKNRKEAPLQSTLEKGPSEPPFGTERERESERDGESRSIGRNRKNGTRSRTERPVIVEKNPEEYPYL